MFLLLLAVYSLLFALGCYAQAPSRGVISVNVVDLRGTPNGRPCCPVNFQTDNNELTQLLYLEPVTILGNQGEWLKIEAIDQPMIYNDSWKGYIGWVEKAQVALVDAYPKPSHSVVVPWTNLFSRSCHMQGCLPEDLILKVSFGTWFEVVGEAEFGWYTVVTHKRTADGQPVYGYVLASALAPFDISESVIREQIARRADQLLGYTYFWGGRSAFSIDMMVEGKQLTGLDCSGFVSINYKSFGKLLPRDASKQALKAIKVTPAQLQVGDVFFYGVTNTTYAPVTHVMLLHTLHPVPMIAESATNSTRILPLAKVYGKPLHELVWGEKLQGGMNPGEYLTWGSFWEPK